MRPPSEDNERLVLQRLAREASLYASRPGVDLVYALAGLGLQDTRFFCWGYGDKLGTRWKRAR